MYRITNRYTKRIYHFLKEARAVEEDYQNQLDYLKQFSDGQFGRDEVKRVRGEMAGALNGIRAQYQGKTAELISDMRKEISRKLAISPTAEQVATLQLLTMRERLTAEEIKAVSPSLAGCPMALKALGEIVKKHELVGVGLPATPSSAALDGAFRALELNAEKLFHNYGTEQWSSGDIVKDSMNRRFAGAEGDSDVFRVFGGVSEFEQFSAAVDHPDATMV